jgi:hypothetical protein
MTGHSVSGTFYTNLIEEFYKIIRGSGKVYNLYKEIIADLTDNRQYYYHPGFLKVL